MTFPGILPLIILIVLSNILTSTLAATVKFHSQVSYTVWTTGGNSERHEVDQSWTMTVVAPSTSMGHIQSYPAGCDLYGHGQGSYLMDGCDGSRRCQVHRKPSKMIADIQLKPDYRDFSLMDGLNVPIEFIPTRNRVPMQSYVAPETAARTHANSPFFKQRKGAHMPEATPRMIRQADIPYPWY